MRIEWIVAAVTCSFVIAGHANAQPTSDAQEDAAILSRVRRLYHQGMELSKRGNTSFAYAAFLEAWRLRHHFGVAVRLGEIELRFNDYRDAAEHFSFAMREMPLDRYAEARPLVVNYMREAMEHVAALSIEVDAADADVLIDDVVVGKTPLADLVFVQPGRRRIEVRSNIRSIALTICAVAGERALPIRLSLRDGSAGAGHDDSVDCPAAPDGSSRPRIVVVSGNPVHLPT